jgi:MFS family permease
VSLTEPTPEELVQPQGRIFDRIFVVQLAVVALSTTAVNAVRPMMTYRALALGAGPLEIGLIAAVFSIAPALLAVAIGRWIDRFGERRFIIGSMLAMTLGGLLAAAATSLPVLAVSQMVIGLGHVTNLIAGQSLVANRGGRDRREHRFGFYSTMGSLGHLAGPLLAAGVVAQWAALNTPLGTQANLQMPAFILAAVATAISLALALVLPGRGRAEPTSAASMAGEQRQNLLSAAAAVLRRPGMPFAMAVSMIVISSVDILIAYLPLYGEVRGLSVGVVGTLLAIRAGSSLVSRLFMGRLIDLLGRNGLLAGSMAMAAAGLLVLPMTGSPLILGAAMVFIGLGLGLGQPMTMAWVANRSPRAVRATALGVRLTGNRSALVIAPIAVGAIAGAAGVGVIFLVVAALLGAGAGIAVITPLDPGRRRGSPDEDSAPG